MTGSKSAGKSRAKFPNGQFCLAARSCGLHANAHVPDKTRRAYFDDLWPLKTDTFGGHRSWVEWAGPGVADEIVEDDADLALGARLYVTTCRPIPVYHATPDEKRRQRMRKKKIMQFVARGLAKAGLYKGVIPEDPGKVNTRQLTLSRPMTGVSSRE